MRVGEKSLIIVEQKYINMFNKFKNKNKITYEIELIKCAKSQMNHSYSERIYNLNLTEKKTKKEQYNYKINIERKNFEKNFFNKYISKKDGIKDNKTINKDKKFTILRNIYKMKKTEEKQKSEIIIKYKYGYKNYEDIKLKTDSLICDNCYRLIYISFDFIKNYISTKCPYCYKFNFYNYNNFIEKLKKANNPLLNSFCHKCLKNVNYSQKNFFLIEKPDYIFFIVCEKCINTKEYKDFIKKIEIKNLIEQNLLIYEKNNDLGKIKELETNYLKEDKINIINNLKIFEEYEKNLNLIEIINKSAVVSLRTKAEQKINKLKQILKIKKIIIDNFHKYSNYIIGNNMFNLLKTIPDLNILDLSRKENYNTKKSNEIIELFLNQEKYIILNSIKSGEKLFDEYKLTKTCLNKDIINENIKDNISKPEEFDLSHLNIININLDNNESIVYNILADYCGVEKIAPIQYNYNKLSNSIKEQEILMYNKNNDRCLYYGIYDVLEKEILDYSIKKLIDASFNDFKCIILNNGADLVVISNSCIYYLSNFRNNAITKNYPLFGNFSELETINNETCVCLKYKKKLVLVSLNILIGKELKDNLIEYQPNDINNNMMNFNMNNNFMNMPMNNNINNINQFGFHNNNQINNNMNNNFNNQNNNNFNNQINNNFNNQNNNNFNNQNNNMNNFNNHMNIMNNNFNNHMNNNMNNNNINNYDFKILSKIM